MSCTTLWTRRLLAITCFGTLLASMASACASGGESEGGGKGGKGGSAATEGGSGVGGVGATGGGGVAGKAGSGGIGGGGIGGGGTAGTAGDGEAGAAADAGLEDAADGSEDGGGGVAGGGGCSSIPEVCNGLDENCNGQIDEGDPGGGADCNVPNKQGECVYGTLHCLSGTGTLTCVQKNQPTVELCDGKDNNCNGAADEGNPGGQQACDTGLLGLCKAGTTACTAGSLQCVPTATPQNEICNGLDDDCDGQTDENNPGGGTSCDTGKLGVCAAGQNSCEAGQLKCAQLVQASAEVCNNKDDDCNGTIDDPLAVNGLPCSTGKPGVCSAGLTQCVAGAPVCNQTTQPSGEKCNALDDDCNGTVDDGNTTTMCTAQYPGAGNVATWSCTAGTCSIATCQPGFLDQNGSPGDGCELATCVSNPSPNTCSGPTASPALSTSNNSYTFTGQLVSANQEAWWAPSFTAPVPGSPFVPTIQLTQNDGGDYRLDVFYGCALAYATCPAAGSTSGSGSGQNITDKWQMNFTNPVSCGAPNGACTNNSSVPTDIKVRVTRIKVGNPCNKFQVSFSQ